MDATGQYVAGLMTAAIRAYAGGIANRQIELQPDVLRHYGSNGFVDLSGDTQHRLLYLAEALATARPKLFSDQVAWQKVGLLARQVSIDYLDGNLACMRDELLSSLPSPGAKTAAAYVESAREHLDQAPSTLPTLLFDGAPHVDLARRYLLAALETRRADALQLVRDAMDDGVDIADLHENVIVRVQAEIGRMWQMGEIHVGEEHYSSALAEEALLLLREHGARPAVKGHRVICTTVGGDLHDLAIRVVSNEFEMCGWTSILLGASTPTPDLLHSLVDFEADLVAISATTALQIRVAADLVQQLRSEPACADVPLLVGGPPFNAVPDLWEVVGADGFAATAGEAPAIGQQLVVRSRPAN